MYNYKMSLSYDGTKYLGWQIQTKEPLKTIQGKLENVLSQLFDEPIHVIASGRTDAGVHAYMQVANFHASTYKDCGEILNYLHQYLPKDIAILELKSASERFHARYNCIGKRYAYYIDTNLFAHPFSTRYSYHVPTSLNVELMEQAAAFLIGAHDFRSFTSMKNKKKSTVRHIHSITMSPTDHGLVIRYEGNGFLQHMVRIMTGTLLEVGLGHIQPEAIPTILEGKSRALAGPLVPSHGLFLEEVLY